MISIKKYSYPILNSMLLGKKAHFTSTCEFFPNFDVTGKVTQMGLKNGEILICVLTNNNKKITIGSNMKDLKFEII